MRAGKSVSCVEVPNQRGCDCALVANLVDALGQKADMKDHFLDKLQNFETVKNIYGSVHQRTCGAGKFVSCVEVPNQCCSDYALVAIKLHFP